MNFEFGFIHSRGSREQTLKHSINSDTYKHTEQSY